MATTPTSFSGDGLYSYQPQPVPYTQASTEFSPRAGLLGEETFEHHNRVDLNSTRDSGTYRPLPGVPRYTQSASVTPAAPPVPPSPPPPSDPQRAEHSEGQGTDIQRANPLEVYSALNTSVSGVQSALNKDPALYTVDHKNGDRETRFDLFRGHADLVKSFSPGLSLNHQKLHGELGGRLDGDIASAMWQKTDKQGSTTVTDGVRAAVTGHYEAVFHGNLEHAAKGQEDSKSDNGIHQFGFVTSHVDAYRNWNMQLSPTQRLDAGVTAGISHTDSSRLGPSPGEDLRLSGNAVTVATYQNYQQDISNRTFLGDHVVWRTKAAEGLVENLSAHRLDTTLQVSSGIEKQFHVEALGRDHAVTVGLGVKAERLPGLPTHVSPDLKFRVNI